MKKLLLTSAAIGIGIVGAVHVSAQTGQPEIVLHQVQPGDTISNVAARYGTTVQTIRAANRRVDDPNLIFVGEVIFVPLAPATPPTTVPPTTTEPPPTTTEPPPSTTEPSPPTTTEPAPPTTIDEGASGTFLEPFTDGDGWLDRWDTHAHFRGEQAGVHPPALTPWRGDHDHDCGPAHSERQISTADRDSFFYICRDHMMTSMGDVDGYSTLAFAPKQTFPTVSRVCWDQNVTDLGGRQWTELVITPAANLPGDGRLAHANPWRQNIDDTSLTHGDGTVGISFMQRYDGVRAFVSRQQVFHSGWNSGSDPEGFESRAIRRQHCVIDNQDGTITVTIDRGAGGTWTRSFAGSFPTDARVIFEDHNYTPDKDGEACRPQGELTGCRYTWHWDNIIVEG